MKCFLRTHWLRQKNWKSPWLGRIADSRSGLRCVGCRSMRWMDTWISLFQRAIRWRSVSSWRIRSRRRGWWSGMSSESWRRGRIWMRRHLMRAGTIIWCVSSAWRIAMVCLLQTFLRANISWRSWMAKKSCLTRSISFRRLRSSVIIPSMSVVWISRIWRNDYISRYFLWIRGILMTLYAHRIWWSIFMSPRWAGLDWMHTAAELSRRVHFCSIWSKHRRLRLRTWRRWLRIRFPNIWCWTVRRAGTWSSVRPYVKKISEALCFGCWIKRRQRWVRGCFAGIWSSHWLKKKKLCSGWMQ